MKSKGDFLKLTVDLALLEKVLSGDRPAKDELSYIISKHKNLDVHTVRFYPECTIDIQNFNSELSKRDIPFENLGCDSSGNYTYKIYTKNLKYLITHIYENDMQDLHYICQTMNYIKEYTGKRDSSLINN